MVVFDCYDIIEEIDYKDMCKYFRKTNNYKKKGRSQEEDTEQKNKICAKKQIKAKKRRRMHCKRLRTVSAFKRSNILRKKLLLNYRLKSSDLPIKKSKFRAQKAKLTKKYPKPI